MSDIRHPRHPTPARAPSGSRPRPSWSRSSRGACWGRSARTSRTRSACPSSSWPSSSPFPGAHGIADEDPLGVLTDRLGGRRVFTALLAFTLLPLAALAAAHESFAALVVFGFFLGFAGASFAVGVPFVNRWFHPSARAWRSGSTASGWAARSSPG